MHSCIISPPNLLFCTSHIGAALGSNFNSVAKAAADLTPKPLCVCLASAWLRDNKQGIANFIVLAFHKFRLFDPVSKQFPLPVSYTVVQLLSPRTVDLNLSDDLLSPIPDLSPSAMTSLFYFVMHCFRRRLPRMYFLLTFMSLYLHLPLLVQPMVSSFGISFQTCVVRRTGDLVPCYPQS